MSFLSRTTPVVRTAFARPSPRLFSTTIAKKNVVKDTAKAVDRTVSDQLVKGIDKGVEAKDTVASTVGMKKDEASGEGKLANMLALYTFR